MKQDNEYEEDQLEKMVNEHTYKLKQDNELTFQDGIDVAYFLQNFILWYRYSKSIKANMDITRGQYQIYELCEEIQLRYGFRLSVEKVQDNTIYVNEYQKI